MTDVIAGSVIVDVVRSTDRPALEELWDGCSERSTYARFFARLRRFPEAYLKAVLTGPPEEHDAVVVRVRDAPRVVGLASLAPSTEIADTVELGVLVADDWQGYGCGSAMVRQLVERAAARGEVRLSASVLPDRATLLRALARRLDLLAVRQEEDYFTGLYRIR